jgi:hypothetical protein
VLAVAIAAYTRMTNADWLDVVASPGIDQNPFSSDLVERELRISFRCSLNTLRRIKNDSYRPSCLSNIAHMRRFRPQCGAAAGSNHRHFGASP